MGLLPVSASLDTVGWFARDPHTLRRVGHVLLQVPYTALRNPSSIVVADDCFHLLNCSVDWVSQAVVKSMEKLFGRQVLRHENLGDYLSSKVPRMKAFQGEKSNGEVMSSFIRLLANIMQMLKRYEFKQNHYEWIKSVKPTLDPVISAQIHQELGMTEAEIENCHAVRNEAHSAVNLL
ncbi:hypothetical protein ACH5RR_008453 [Cinchona calisaya]|uniref:Uncharacterized protein n=1 Tax=Cinchona calisaya TaxID=153742 RepID=A0ABD3ABI1_9GENT